MAWQAIYDNIWRCILSNVAAGTHNAICNVMKHQIWNICDVTCICINLLHFKGLPWRSVIKSVFENLHINVRVHTYWQSFGS